MCFVLAYQTALFKTGSFIRLYSHFVFINVHLVNNTEQVLRNNNNSNNNTVNS
jgi:hypothetical protein